MKKTLTIIVAIFIIVSSIIYINRHSIITDTTSTDREQNVKMGKDTVFVWEDGVFQIGHYSTGNHLEFHENGITTTILKNVDSYKIKDHKFYVVTKEGYAVIDQKNIAKILLTVPESEYTNGYSINKNGKKEPYSRFIDNTNIQYIMNFDEFTESEQKVLNKLIN